MSALEHKGTVTLETERLILRRFTRDDAQDMFDTWAGDEETTRYLSWGPHASVENSRGYAEYLEGNYANPNAYDWCLVLKETGKPVGSLGVVRINDALGEAEIGWVIGRSYWGRGLMPEAGRRVIDFLLDEVGFNRVCAVHDAQNPKSGRAMIKCGMRYEGTLRQGGLGKAGNRIDLVMYSILKSDVRRKDALV